MNQSPPTILNAVYQNGSLKLERPLGLPEGTKLQVTILSPTTPDGLNANVEKIVRETLVEDRDVFEALGR